MELLNNNNEEINEMVVEHIYSVDKYLVINTTNGNYLYDGNSLYFLGEYSNVEKVIVLNNDIYVIVRIDNFMKIIDLLSLDIILSEKNVVGMIAKENGYVAVHLYSRPNKLFDLNRKEYVKTPLDLAFSHILDEDLFVYENEKYGEFEHKYYIVNKEGEIVYNCNSSFPYFVDGNLILINKLDEEINVVHNLLGNRDKSTVIKKQGIVLGKPQYYKGNIVIVVEDGIVILDVDTNIKKKISYNVKYPISDTIIEKDSFLMKIKINDSFKTIAIGLNYEYIIEHDSIELLPYWINTKKTLFCSNFIVNNLKEYYLYDEEGNLLYKKQSRDAFIIENENYNLFIFYGIDGSNRNCVYNINTREEVIIPWDNIEFGINNESSYQRYALCYNIETNNYDIIDDNLGVCFSNIDRNIFKRNISNITYTINNNYVSFLEPISDGTRTYYRNIIIDKNNNVIYEGYDACITHIGIFIEIKTNDTLKYLNTITGEITSNVNSFVTPILPEGLCIEDNILKLKKSLQ